MPRFSETDHDLVLCQICGRDVDIGREQVRWRVDVTGSRSAGNVCPACLKLHAETGLVGEALRERAGLRRVMVDGYDCAIPVTSSASPSPAARPQLRFLSAARPGPFGSGWSRLVEVDGIIYYVGVTRGKAVRIPYRPRGQNIGYLWDGFVNTKAGDRIWAGAVNKSTGCSAMLKAAGLL